MVKIIKDVKVPMEEVVAYLVEKGYLTEEFEDGGIEKVDVVHDHIIERGVIGGVDLLNFRANANLDLNDYVKKNQIDKYINNQMKEKTVKNEKTESKVNKDIDNNNFKSFFKMLNEIIEEETLKGGR